MNTIKSLIKNLVLIIACSVFGLVILSIVLLLPVNNANVAASHETLDIEGGYPRALIQANQGVDNFEEFYPDVLDNGTDNLMLLRAGMEPEKNVIYAAMDMKHYSYYWHGYVTVLRPILLFMDLNTFRSVNLGIQLLLITLLCIYIYKAKAKFKYILAILSVYFLMSPVALAQSLQFSWIFYVTAIIAALVLCQKNISKERLFLYFCLSGILTSFFDLLTYPLISWAFPLLFFFLFKSGDNDKEKLIFTVQSGLSWIMGYAGMWVMKWTLGTLITGKNIFKTAMSEVFMRAVDGLSTAARFDALYKNWHHYEFATYAVIIIAWIVWWIVKDFSGIRNSGKTYYSYMLIGLSSLVWYFVLANHTGIHHFFTYRIFAISIMACLFCALEISENPVTSKLSLKGYLFKCLSYGVLAVISLIFALTVSKESTYITNTGLALNTSIPINNDEEVSFSFTPAESRINMLGFCFDEKFAGENLGNITVKISDNDKTKYSKTYDITPVTDSSLQETWVNWKLKKNKQYTISLKVSGITEPVHLMMAEDCFLGEFDTAEAGQPVSYFVYRVYPASKKMIVFLVLSWLGFLSLLWNNISKKLFFHNA